LRIAIVHVNPASELATKFYDVELSLPVCQKPDEAEIGSFTAIAAVAVESDAQRNMNMFPFLLILQVFRNTTQLVRVLH